MALESAWIPLAGALFGGVGLKMLEHWLGRSKTKIDEAANIRVELRSEITALRDEVKTLETDVDNWRNRYLDLRDKQVEINIQLANAMQQIKDEAAKERIKETLDTPAEP